MRDLILLVSSQMADLTVADENKLCKRLLLRRENDIGARPYTSIPRSVVQFWDQEDIPADVRACMESWRALKDLGYDYVIYNNATAIQFIEEYYSHSYIEAYRHCHHPAMRCDYFRMLYLLSRGGVYADADNVLTSLVRFDDILKSNASLYLSPLFQDKTGGRIIMMAEGAALSRLKENDVCVYFANDPLICGRGDPVVRLALDRATQLLLEHGRSGMTADIHDVTGPSNMTKALCAYFNYWQDVSFSAIQDWDRLVSVRNDLVYKGTDRNWRAGKAVMSDA